MTRPRPTPGRRCPFGPIGAAALAAVLAAPSLLASPQSTQSSSSSESASDRAEARDSAQDSQRSSQTSSQKSSQKSSHTRRVVVKDGKTVVDEETRDGQPAGGRARRAPAAGGNVAPGAGRAIDPQAEVERMMREMEEQMQREMPRAMADALREARAKGGPVRRSGRSSYSRRYRVENGKVVVDEETRDGKPARGGQAPGAIDPQAEVERMMREMEARMRREMGGQFPGGANARGGAGGPVVDRQSSKSSHTRRVVVENGETLVDEEVRDGVPVRNRGGERTTPKAGGGDPQLEIQQLMREFEAERAARERSPRGAGQAPTRRGGRRDAVTPKASGPQPLRPVRGAAPPLRPRATKSAPPKRTPPATPRTTPGTERVTRGR